VVASPDLKQLLLSWLLHKQKREYSNISLKSQKKINFANVSTNWFSHRQGLDDD